MSTTKKAMLMIFGFGLVLFSMVIIFREDGLLDLREMRLEMADSANVNAVLKKENKILYNKVERLKNDSDYLENVARKELGMIKDDEIIIKFHSNRNNNEK